ncbi:MAG: hypothetical protein AAGA12_06555 [Pseudomonadota bacterium]
MWRAGINALCLAFLTACDAFPLPGSGTDPGVTVTRSQITLLGPTGYCVDPKSVQNSEKQAFAIFGNCAALSTGLFIPQPRERAVALASVSSLGLETPRISEAPDTFLDVITSDVGKVALSRTGDPETVEIFESFVDDGTVYIFLNDGSETAVPGTADRFWRAYFDVSDALITVSLQHFDEEPLSRSEGLSALRDFVRHFQDQPSAD